MNVIKILLKVWILYIGQYDESERLNGKLYFLYLYDVKRLIIMVKRNKPHFGQLVEQTLPKLRTQSV